MSVEELGETAVLDAMVTPTRAVEVIGGLVGPTVSFGPVPVGPRDLATATADGDVGRLTGRRTGPGSVVVSVPAHLDVTVLVGRRRVPVEVDLVVRVRLASHVAGDAVEVDVAPITAADIDVDARTSGAGGVFVRRMADLEGEIRHHVGVYISALLATPEAVAACRLPV